MSGLFGVITKKDCFKDLLHGVEYHTHLGTEFGGMAVVNNEGTIQRRIHDIRYSQFRTKFYEDRMELKGNIGIGVISDRDEQPIFLNSKFGPFAMASAGLLENADELIKELHNNNLSLSESTDGAGNYTEIVAKLISQGKTIVDGIESMFSKIKGSASILLLTKDGIYAARDRFGYTPLVIAERNGEWAVTSETTAFPNTGFDVKKVLLPGEVVLISNSGMKELHAGGDTSQICTFLWIYTGFPASNYEGINVERVREKTGAFLARRDNIKPTLVSGVPDSGVAHAIGYAMESGIPFRRPLVKYTPVYGRSYTPPSQETRDLVAKMKLIPIREIIEGEKIIVCEDSIVRGTQLKNFTIQKLWGNGAKEVHVRPACPPLMFPCRFCLSTRSIHELAARRAIKALEGCDLEDVSEYCNYTSEKYQKMVNWIGNDLGVTSLRYQTIDDMVDAVGLPREKLCLYCWNGECRAKDNVDKEEKWLKEVNLMVGQ